jgi:site-specific recombinase XerD
LEVIVYRRHSQDCDHKDDRYYRRCNCTVWLQTNEKGKQRLWSAKTRNWAEAERQGKEIERAYDATGAVPTAAKTVEEAIKLFLDAKRGEQLSPDTLYRHEYITGLLLVFCNRENIVFLKDVNLAHLTSWRAEWSLKSPQARRSRQEKVKNFFKFCFEAGMIPTNPALKLSRIVVKNEAAAVRPFDPAEYDAVITAVNETEMTDANKARVKACMQLQRFSGLSLVDAVTLSKDELVQDGAKFRVRCERQKTGTHVNNVIPSWLGKELLRVKNGNPEYFFWSGKTSIEDAPSYFHKLYRRVFKASGLLEKRECGSHDFRHTYAVELLKAGVDIRKVSKTLGHSSIQVTERFYSKWNRAQQDILDADLEKALNAAASLA